MYINLSAPHSSICKLKHYLNMISIHLVLHQWSASGNQHINTQYYHSWALNRHDSEAWWGLIWAVSDMLLLIHTGRWHYPPISHLIDAAGMCFMADTHGLAGKTRQFKTIGFILCAFLYLTHTTPLAVILNTIDSQ